MKKYESGRSMVEMLGVLAIIGVLSIGGIAGYTLAMDKYRANENLATGSACVILAQSDKGGNGLSVGDNKSCGPSDGYKLNVRDNVTMTVHRLSNQYRLEVVDTKDVCDQMYNAFPDDGDSRKPYDLYCHQTGTADPQPQGGQQEPTPQEGNPEV